MEMTPLLDLALGAFLAVFGLILERLGRSQFKESRQRADQNVGWQKGAFALMIIIAAGAALISGWLYLLGQESRFLVQTLIASFLVMVGAFQIRRLSSQSLKASLRLLNDSSLWIAGILMGVCGTLILLTYPLVVNRPPEGLLYTVHNGGQIIGVIAGFSTIAFMLVNLFVAES